MLTRKSLELLIDLVDIGALLPGIIISLVAYYVTIPVVRAYQTARLAKSDERRERRRKLKAALVEAASRLRPHRDADKGDGSGSELP